VLASNRYAARLDADPHRDLAGAIPPAFQLLALRRKYLGKAFHDLSHKRIRFFDSLSRLVHKARLSPQTRQDFKPFATSTASGGKPEDGRAPT